MNILRGFNVPPAVVGLARGFLEAVTVGAVVGAIAWLTTADISALGLGETATVILLPAALQVLRFLEGVADQIDPENQRS